MIGDLARGIAAIAQSGRQPDTTMMASGESESTKFIDIATNGLRCDFETFGKFFYRAIFLLMNQFNDALLTDV
ncbi:hypothetical protein THF1A12_200060 [Vibrio jasicida]|uniref:Uncharacterized protein n=1 Tax=Vibrio jasicida TaxID=766224 RepID=A0AAU9QKS1_9VIBR|nr:hypothetical protein THF1A12_200060 [Vibrio jasicida]